ncbi:MAG TPA: hypothetical protein VKE69_02525, partial [Planctomycetota bacterium]|nr:hypothetical protein [Planctomycetota bacterium]
MVRREDVELAVAVHVGKHERRWIGTDVVRPEVRGVEIGRRTEGIERLSPEERHSSLAERRSEWAGDDKVRVGVARELARRDHDRVADR